MDEEIDVETENIEDIVKEIPAHCDKPIWHYTFPIMSIIVYIVDVCSDLMLAREYYIDGEILYFYLTLAFALSPFFILNPIVVILRERR